MGGFLSFLRVMDIPGQLMFLIGLHPNILGRVESSMQGLGETEFERNLRSGFGVLTRNIGHVGWMVPGWGLPERLREKLQDEYQVVAAKQQFDPYDLFEL